MNAQLGSDPELGAYVARGLEAARELRLPLPDIVVIEPLAWPNERYYALYDWFSRKLTINPNSAFWAGGPEAIAQRIADAYREGEWSSDHRFHPILHEIGHHVHAGVNRAGYVQLANLDEPLASFQRRQDEIEREVSRYAASAPIEFVAEVYAGRMAGRTFPESIMELAEFYLRW